jgi:hypothetical protein
MKMPGFTAEACLYKTNRHYQMVGSFNTVTGSPVVLARARDYWVCIRTRTGDLSCIRIRLPDDGPVLA